MLSSAITALLAVVATFVSGVPIGSDASSPAENKIRSKNYHLVIRSQNATTNGKGIVLEPKHNVDFFAIAAGSNGASEIFFSTYTAREKELPNPWTGLQESVIFQWHSRKDQHGLMSFEPAFDEPYYESGGNLKWLIFGVTDEGGDNRRPKFTFLDDIMQMVVNAPTPRNLNHWHVCDFRVTRPPYIPRSEPVVAWLDGSVAPTNPTCHKVDIIRKWI